MAFEDHFSSHPGSYARHRPRYPDELFAWLAKVSPGRDLAWDAGTGSGQAAVALAEHFDRMVATDASAGQLSRAVAHERIDYRLEPSGRSTLPGASVDLTTVAAAAHWFELDDFYREVRRVARRGGVLALFSYGPRDFADAVHPIVHHLQEVVLGPFWPERIQYVHDRYATLPFPFEEIAPPAFEVTVSWNLEEALAFFETWSASQRYFDTHGIRATRLIQPELSRDWGDPAERRIMRCPIFMRVGRVR